MLSQGRGHDLIDDVDNAAPCLDVRSDNPAIIDIDVAVRKVHVQQREVHSAVGQECLQLLAALHLQLAAGQGGARNDVVGQRLMQTAAAAGTNVKCF